MSNRSPEEPAAQPESPATKAAKVVDASKRFAGPSLIVAGVLAILKDFAAGSLFPRQFELLGYWLPNFCFLGRSLRAGHIPLLNPHVMGGIPFAADPQAGWMNLSAMGLSAALPCDMALRAYLILMPILAGLGMYWFLRTEGLTRTSATVGGLVLALPLAGSKNFTLPWISGSVAWTAILLATGSRFWRARDVSARIMWAVLAALAWGQLASAHFSTGLLVGTAFLVAYLVTRAGRDIVAKRSTSLQAVLPIALLMGALMLVNLASLIPRVTYIRRTPLGLGFEQLQVLNQRLVAESPSRPGTLAPPWPLAMALSPGIHQGAVALALCFGGVMLKGRRSFAAMFAFLGGIFYLLTLPVAEKTLQPLIQSTSLSGAYLHGPGRLQPGVFVAVSVLAGLGVDAWLRAPSIRHRALAIIPGLLMWGILLLTFRPPAAHLELSALGGGLGLCSLVASARVRRVAFLVPLVLSLELWLNGQPRSASDIVALAKGSRGGATIQGQVSWTPIDVSAFLRPGPIALTLKGQDGGRYLTAVPGSWTVVGYFGGITPKYWGLMGNQQSMVFDLREAQGYNAVLPLRYWEFVRAIEPGKQLGYQASYFRHPPPVALNLLQVGWVVGPADGSPPLPGAVPLVGQGAWALYRLAQTAPMASVIGSWDVVGSPEAALQETAAAGFDPSSTVVLERDPGLGAPAGASALSWSANYRQLGDQAATIEVESSRSAVVLVRNTFDSGWHASVDGRSAPVLAADYVIQAVPVPAGRHVIRLWYDDPTIGYGLAGSATALLALVGASFALRRSRRRATRKSAPSSPQAKPEIANPTPMERSR